MAVAKTHVSLNVADIDRSVLFYEAFFGVPAHKRRPGYANFDLSEPPLKLALNQQAVAGKGALNHLGILVDSTEAVEAARDRLKEAGLATFDEKDTVCCWARQEKVWATDPDGNGWEIYTLLEDEGEPADDSADLAADSGRAGCCTPTDFRGKVALTMTAARKCCG